MTYKLKPTWNFQSIEITVDDYEKTIDEIIDLYKEVLDKLVKISPEQSQQKGKPAPAAPLATDRQKSVMRSYGIPFDSCTTSAEAQKLIQESIEKSTL